MGHVKCAAGQPVFWDNEACIVLAKIGPPTTVSPVSLVFPAFPELVLIHGLIEAIEVHHLVPRRDEVGEKLLLGIRAGINLSQGTKLGVRTEDKISAGSGPFYIARRAVATFEPLAGIVGRLPGRAHIKQIDKEVVRQLTGPIRENAVL